MKDVEFISILMLVILERKIVGFPQSALDQLYEKYEPIFSEEEEESFFQESSFDVTSARDDSGSLDMDQAVSAHDATNEDREEDFEVEFLNAKEYIAHQGLANLLTSNKLYGAKRTTHIYTLWTYIVLIDEKLSVEDFAPKYIDFFEKFSKLKETDIDEWPQIKESDNSYQYVINYYENASGAATEEPQRKSRLEALRLYVVA